MQQRAILFTCLNRGKFDATPNSIKNHSIMGIVGNTRHKISYLHSDYYVSRPVRRLMFGCWPVAIISYSKVYFIQAFQTNVPTAKRKFLRQFSICCYFCSIIRQQNERSQKFSLYRNNGLKCLNKTDFN